jgi:hypothetical protein
MSNVFTPLPEAITEITTRRRNQKFFQAVNTYLNNDVPPHFSQPHPILYLCRHIATPNFEALRFIEIGRPTGLPLVIGEDHKGIFFADNRLKRALGKLPIVKGLTRHRDEIVEYCTVIDFAQAQGCPFNVIETIFRIPIIAFHHALFNEIYQDEVTIIDESTWIDRNHREDLQEQYKRMLALLIVHGIMLESYSPDEQRLVEAVLGPAFTEITEHFGVRPLIAELISSELEQKRDWNAYPSVLYQHIRGRLPNHNSSPRPTRQVLS